MPHDRHFYFQLRHLESNDTFEAETGVNHETTEVKDEELIPKLKAIAAERTSDKIFVRADGAVTYARVAQVMGALNAGGFNNIGLVTDPGGPSFDGSN